ncbi:MAG TPA: hypothetical protein VJT73_06720 [Polyangiaceae bacterium]|nr:hypothetical protein [Polyangiaceae bacterium]
MKRADGWTRAVRRLFLSMVVLVGFACGGKAAPGAEYGPPPVDAGIDRGRVNDAATKESGAAMTSPDAQFVDAADRPVMPQVDAGTPGPKLTALTIEPAESKIVLNATVVLKVTGTFSDATTADVTSKATFITSDASVVSLMGNVATARAPGIVKITAALSGLLASATISIDDRTVVALTVSSDWNSCQSGRSVSFRARAKMSDGFEQDVTSQATWEASAPPVIVFETSNRAFCLTAGSTTVKASLGAISGELKFDVYGVQAKEYFIEGRPVVSPGWFGYYSLVARYDDGGEKKIPNTTFESDTPAVLDVGPQGHATARAPGSATITAKVANVALTTLKVVVTNATLTKVEVTPGSLELAFPNVGQLTATGTYSDGTQAVLTRLVRWEVGDGSSVSVANGAVTPVSLGKSTVSTYFEGAPYGSAEITVVLGAPSSIRISSDVEGPIGVAREATAFAEYPGGEQLDVASTVTWHSDDPSIAIFEGPNLVGLKPGRTTFYATLGALKSEMRQATITNVALLAIEFDSTHPTINVRSTFLLHVNGTFEDGSTYDVTAGATLKTGNVQIATISNAALDRGTVTAVAAGTTSLSATVGELATSTTVTVYP